MKQATLKVNCKGSDVCVYNFDDEPNIKAFMFYPDLVLVQLVAMCLYKHVSLRNCREYSTPFNWCEAQIETLTWFTETEASVTWFCVERSLETGLCVPRPFLLDASLEASAQF